jgi:hypothetical protein
MVRSFCAGLGISMLFALQGCASAPAASAPAKVPMKRPAWAIPVAQQQKAGPAMQIDNYDIEYAPGGAQDNTLAKQNAPAVQASLRPTAEEHKRPD